MSYLIKEKSWQVDKRISPALMLALALQIAGGLIWASQLDARVARIEQDIQYMRSRIDVIVTPAKAGVYSRIDSRLRGNDEGGRS